MDLTIGEAVIWAVIGLLSGSIAGMLVKGKKEGFGWVTNLIFGLIGAIVGGVAMDKLDFSFGLGKLVLDLNLLVAAVIGSVAIVIIARFIESRRQKGD